MSDRYEIRSKSGNVTGYIVKESTSSHSSSSRDETGFAVLFLTYPFLAAIGGLVGALLGALLTVIGRVVVAAIAKALGARPESRDWILAVSPFDGAQVVGLLTFYALLLYLTVKWFRNSENREIFVFTIVAVAIVIALIAGWKFLNSYALN